MLVATLSVNHVCPFKYRTREYEIEQIPIYATRLRWKKLKRKKISLNKPQNSSKIIFVLRSIHRVERKHI